MQKRYQEHEVFIRNGPCDNKIANVYSDLEYFYWNRPTLFSIYVISDFAYYIRLNKEINLILRTKPVVMRLIISHGYLTTTEPGSSVITVTGYGLDGRGSIPDRGREFFL
jgi:hypothetical protein